MMGGTEVKALVDLAAAMGIHSGTFHVQAIAEKAVEHIHHLTAKVTSLEQDNTWLRGKVAEHLRQRDALLAEVVKVCGFTDASFTHAILHINNFVSNLQADLAVAEQEAENAYTVAEGTIRAEIADAGTSCHWCLEKTAKAERERCVEIIRARGKEVKGAIDPERTIAVINTGLAAYDRSPKG